MKRRILSIFTIIIILIVNFSFVNALPGDPPPGRAIKDVATLITQNTYLGDEYNAKSLEVTQNKIEIFKYNPSKHNSSELLSKKGFKTKENIKNEFNYPDYTSSDGGYYLLFSQGEINNDQGETSAYDDVYCNFKFQAGNHSYNNVASFLYRNGIEFNGTKYHVQLDISKVSIKTKEGCKVSVNVRLGRRIRYSNTEELSTSLSDYTIPTYPSIHATNVSRMNNDPHNYDENARRFTDYKIDLDIDYKILDASYNPVKISGTWGITELDHRESVTIKDFSINTNADNANLFVTKSLYNNSAVIDTLRYKTSKKDGKTNTNIFAYVEPDYVNGIAKYDKDKQETKGADVYIRVSNKDTISFTKSWDSFAAGANFRLVDLPVPCIYKIEHYKQDPNSIYSTPIYYPNPANVDQGTGLPGKTITINSTNVSKFAKTYRNYTLNLQAPPTVSTGKLRANKVLILKLYYDLEFYNIYYKLYGGVNDPANPSKYTTETNTITFRPATRSGYDFKGWYLDSAYTTEKTNIPKGSKGDVTVHAKWEPSVVDVGDNSPILQLIIIGIVSLAGIFGIRYLILLRKTNK